MNRTNYETTYHYRKNKLLKEIEEFASFYKNIILVGDALILYENKKDTLLKECSKLGLTKKAKELGL